MAWELDAPLSYVLRGGRDAADVVRLRVAEVIARGTWLLEHQDRRRGRGALTPVLRAGGPPPTDMDSDSPVPAAEALLRELRSDEDDDERWEGTADDGGVRLAERGRWVRARWVTRHTFVQQAAALPLRRRGLLEERTGRGGISWRLTADGAARKAELDALEGRRVEREPAAALAAAGALGSAVLLVEGRLPQLRAIAVDAGVLGGGDDGGGS